MSYQRRAMGVSAIEYGTDMPRPDPPPPPKVIRVTPRMAARSRGLGMTTDEAIKVVGSESGPSTSGSISMSTLLLVGLVGLAAWRVLRDGGPGAR